MRHPSSRRRRAAAVVAMVFALAAFPLGTAAIHQFSDVPDSNIFHNDISAIADVGVTTGCAAGLYCPSAYVTREQMAAFMNRLGALASDKTPVVNATTVDRYNANEMNRLAYTSSASLLDGNASSTGRLTLTIDVPRRGYLAIWGHGNEYFQGSNGESYVDCWIEVDQSQVQGTYQSTDNFYDTDVTDSNFDNDSTGCATSGGYLVCGGTYTVDLEFQLGNADDNIVEASLMAEYVPFNGAGNPPSIFACLVLAPTTPHAPAADTLK